ncbi:MAG: lysophospholipid acyltransferase family protein [Bacillota bacterium]
MLYWVGRNLFALIFTLIWRWKIIGSENVPLQGPVVMVSNHVTYLDPFMIGGTTKRKVFFMAKAELFKIPILGFLIRNVSAFPVKRGKGDRAALRACMEVLQRGDVLGLFPEGTRSKTGELLPFQGGAALVALKTGAPIVPVAIIGKPGWNLRPFKVVVGKPLAIDEIVHTCGRNVDLIAQEARQAIIRLIQQAS